MNSDLKTQWRELRITAAKETQVDGDQKVVIIFVPGSSTQVFSYNPSLASLGTGEKVHGKHIVFIAQRKSFPQPTWKSHTKIKQKCPRSCILRAVQDALLKGLVYPRKQGIYMKLDSCGLLRFIWAKHSKSVWNIKLKLFLVSIIKAHRQRCQF